MTSLPSHEKLKEMTLTNVTVGYDGDSIVKEASFQLLEGQIGCLL
ncbi:hypothetical protein [Marinomonas sp. GJ51-6]|nr:hypothetical protein [Marinomonas sp. GJ51-6]WOD08396.1 hypothetical protein ONZ50_04610 [Marinomonas sp. GJ51-6]